MQFLRAIMFDDSDRRVYARPATPGEWAIPGRFALWDVEPERLEGKALQAFARGFLGASSFGHVTLTQVDHIGAEELEAVTERIAEHLLAHYGAPDRGAAREVAEEEVRFTAELSECPVHTLLAVERESS
nr:hypothetical protein [Gammaproteobacteria bacterium]